jgi:hypothetical protein
MSVSLKQVDDDRIYEEKKTTANDKTETDEVKVNCCLLGI